MGEQLELPEPKWLQIVGFSGGKDSTAMVYRMAERGEEFKLLFTPTGNEMPGVEDFVHETARKVGRELIIPKGPKLMELIQEFKALPSHRMRWCTRMIKIEPCIAFFKSIPKTQAALLCVGLRADEEKREGLYSKLIKSRFPLVEFGWNKADVLAYLKRIGVCVPPRTDCALCYEQSLLDWKNLLRNYPALYAHGEALEQQTGHTFRSPTRDAWPARLADLRVEFESGRKIRGEDKRAGDDICRVCRL